jgi:hypothetical protein
VRRRCNGHITNKQAITYIDAIMGLVCCNGTMVNESVPSIRMMEINIRLMKSGTLEELPQSKCSMTMNINCWSLE